MGTKASAILLVFLTSVLTSGAQALYKIGAKSLSWDIVGLITNVPLVSGLILYGIGAILFIKALQGGEVSVLYPIVATSYLWVALLSGFLFGESIGLLRWAGVIVVVIGVMLVGFGSREYHSGGRALQ